jgi:hypothetical protein
MRARRTTRCTLCDFYIYPGDIIAEVCGEWVHRDCAIDSGEEFVDDYNEEDDE